MSTKKTNFPEELGESEIFPQENFATHNDFFF